MPASVMIIVTVSSMCGPRDLCSGVHDPYAMRDRTLVVLSQSRAPKPATRTDLLREAEQEQERRRDALR